MENTIQLPNKLLISTKFAMRESMVKKVDNLTEELEHTVKIISELTDEIEELSKHLPPAEDKEPEK